MKVVLIGSTVRYGWPDTFRSAFADLGHEAVIVDDEKIYKASSSLAQNRYLSHFFWRFLALSFQNKFIASVVSERPDLILFFKGFLIRPTTLRAIKKKLPKVLLFNYNPDNPFNTWHHGNSNSWIRQSIPLYDAYFIWGKFLERPITKAGAKRFVYLPCCYDQKFNRPTTVTEMEIKMFGSDIVFIGSWDEEREGWLGHLLDYDLKIWGNGWQKASAAVQAKWMRREVVGDDFAKVCGAAKMVLNFVRKQNGPSHNMKTYEIPACRGFMLATRTEEQSALLKEGIEADYFSDDKELIGKINYYLIHDGERQKIAEAGYKKIINGANTYKDRANKILEVFKDIKSGN